jgi:hypothetical protein
MFMPKTGEATCGSSSPDRLFPLQQVYHQQSGSFHKPFWRVDLVGCAIAHRARYRDLLVRGQPFQNVELAQIDNSGNSIMRWFHRWLRANRFVD